jgi:hypothetical protein
MSPLCLVGRPGNFWAYPGMTLAEALAAHEDRFGAGPWSTVELPMDRPWWCYDAAEV